MVDCTPRPRSQPERSRTGDKALIVALGHDYEPEGSAVGPLKTAIRDAHDFVRLLLVKGYLKHNITVMTDSADNENMRPTRDNIFRELDNFTRDVRVGDRRVFSFGGHGSQVVSHTGEEVDDLDEVLLVHGHSGWPIDEAGRPLDPWQIPPKHPDQEKLKGIIIDNELHKRLVKKLEGTGSRLTAIFDTCHSGTMLDLNYHWKYLSSQYITVPSPQARSPRGAGLKLLGSPPSRKKSLPRPKASGDILILDKDTAVLTMSPDDKNDRPLYDEPDDSRTDVYSLSSSEGGQRTWDLDGVSMLSYLQTLTRLLREKQDTSMTVREVMLEFQHRLDTSRKDAFLCSELARSRGKSWAEKIFSKFKKMQFPQFGSQTRSAPHKKFSL